MKILIGAISSSKAITICGFIKTFYPDVELLTYDFKPCTKKIKTKYSDWHFVISAGDKIAELKKIINLKSIDLFIPVMSAEIENIIENRSMFGAALAYVGSLESYKILHYKNKLMDLADSLNIRIPKSYDSIKNAILPFIIKPINSSSALGVHYIFTEKDRLNIDGKLNTNEIVIQEYIKGTGAGYSVFSKNGGIVVGSGHKRLAEYPISGGSSVYRESFVQDDMINISKKIISAVNWSGFCMFEFKINDCGEAVLIEANPRIWGSINQGLANGVNYFEPLLGTASISAIKQTNYNTYLAPLIYKAMIKYLLKGRLSVVIKFLVDMNKKADVSLFKDFRGYLSLIAKRIRIKHFLK